MPLAMTLFLVLRSGLSLQMIANQALHRETQE